jgi:predicted AlkP superfamily pyrophosphatase or phosphodiesterase
MPEAYLQPDEHGLKVPNLRELVRKGAYSEGARSVFPTSTYPAHTAIVTGANPGTHGIYTNRPDDPQNTLGDAMRFYTEDIRVPTLYQVAKEKGLRTASIYWPVTMGAKMDAIVPEFWRSQDGSVEDQKLQRVISTPGLIEEVGRRFPDFYQGFKPPRVEDVPPAHVAVHLIETLKPHLLLLHMFDVDHHTHNEGIFSDKARERIEIADAQIGRVIEAAKRAGTWRNTVLVVVSDHGMAPYQRRVRPGVWLRDAGLVKLDSNHRVAESSVWISTAGGSAFFYLKDERDEEVRQRLMALLQARLAEPNARISKIYTREEIVALGGDPRAFAGVEAAEGIDLSFGYSGDAEFGSYTHRAHHGKNPAHPSMAASLIFYGPSIAAGKIARARLIDVAPTVAPLLGLRLERAEGQALPVPRKAGVPKQGS